jgi:hypothetical protein
VGRIRNDDAGPFDVAALAMKGAHHQETGEFAVRAGAGLKRNAGEAADLREPPLQLEHQRKIALHGFLRLQRVRLGEARHSRDRFVDFRVELHGAGAERIKARIHAEIALRQSEVVAHHIELRQLGQTAIRAHFLRWEIARGHVARRQVHSGASGRAQLIDGRYCVVHQAVTFPSAIAN